MNLTLCTPIFREFISGSNILMVAIVFVLLHRAKEYDIVQLLALRGYWLHCQGFTQGCASTPLLGFLYLCLKDACIYMQLNSRRDQRKKQLHLMLLCDIVLCNMHFKMKAFCLHA